MQLDTTNKTKKSQKRVGQALAAATCSLLSVGTQAADKDITWDLSNLHYSETGRVTVSEQILAYKRKHDDGRVFSLKLNHDTISGATPNGAYFPTTITSPSGTSYNGVLAEIRDERYAVAAQWEREDSRLQETSYGMAFSTELDYDSLSGNWQRKRESKDRMRSVNYGVSVNYDLVHAEGGNPIGLAPATDTTRTSYETKIVIDALAGITQVIDRKTLLQLNYTLSLSNGYLNDPYKYVSIDDKSVTDNLLFEKRPGQRIGNGIYARLIHNHKGNVAKGSYRFYIDDWGILSHTFDLRYRYRMKRSWYVQPHLRIYSQSATRFYSDVWIDPIPAGSYASADYRLGNIDSLTLGLQAGKRISKKTEFSLRVESLRQSDRLYNFSTLNATIAQLSIRYKL